MELADVVIEAAQGRRGRAPRAHRCTGRSRTTPSAHSEGFNCSTFVTKLYKAVRFLRVDQGQKTGSEST